MKKTRISNSKFKISTILSLFVSLFAVLSASVSTYAWFQAQASVNIQTTSTSATITVSRPDSVRFYRFNGNGIPSSSYYGYSPSGASFGNTTNVIDTSANTYKLGDSSAVNYRSSAFDNVWTEINIDNSSQVSAAFDFSLMRPGCYYSFCIYTPQATSKLKISFSLTGGINIDGTSNNRYVATSDSGAEATDYPLNFLMGVNGYASASTNTGANVESFIDGTIDATSASDKIVYNHLSPASDYYLLGTSGSSVDTSSNNYIYFTIFMGYSTKSDALLLRKNISGKNYYSLNQASGSYSALDGLKSTLTAIEVL